MGCTTSIVKYLLFFFNLAFVLVGIAFIAVGSVVVAGLDKVLEDIEALRYFKSIPIIVIVVGVIIFIISFFGCCGAIKESTCMLTMYAVMLIIILVLQIALGVWAFLQIKDRDDIYKAVQGELRKLLNKYDGHEKPFDIIQEELKCCGVTGPDDYNGIGTWYPLLPTSCCRDKQDTCTSLSENSYKRGCTEPFVDFIEKYVRLAGIIVLSLGAVELLGAIIAFCLSSSLRG